MEALLTQLSKWFGPSILALPSPAIPAPGNWLVPLAIHLAIAHYALKTLLSSEGKWLGHRLICISKDIFKRISSELEYPGKMDRRPLRDMIGSLGACVVHYSLALYAVSYSTATCITAVLLMGRGDATQSLLWLGLSCLPLPIALFYRARGSKQRRELVRNWRAYRRKGVKAYAALSAVPLACIAISFGVALVQSY